MNIRDRLSSLLDGSEPDIIPVFASDTLTPGSPGGWVRRLTKRGMGIIKRVCPYRPYFSFPSLLNLFVPEVHWIMEQYIDKGKLKIRYTLDTPRGKVDSVIGIGVSKGKMVGFNREEFFIKKRADWRVFAYLFTQMRQIIKPNYEEIMREEDTLGESGLTIGYLTKTSFPLAWTKLASLEQAILDYNDKSEELMEFLEAEKKFHIRAAEITAECPVRILNFYDNITDMVSPRFFESFCVPTYKIYSTAIEGTDKFLACHMDGLLAHLKLQIARSPIKIIDSLTVPPTGNVSLKEAKSIWKDKIIFINCPAHLAYKSDDVISDNYEHILEEWGSKLLLIEYVENLPQDELEGHLNVVLNVCGYPD